MADKANAVRQAAIDAARRFRHADSVAERRRKELHAAIVTAIRAGETKSQLARDTGYTREYITELVKVADERDAKAAAAARADS